MKINYFTLDWRPTNETSQMNPNGYNTSRRVIVLIHEELINDNSNIPNSKSSLARSNN